MITIPKVTSAASKAIKDPRESKDSAQPSQPTQADLLIAAAIHQKNQKEGA